MQKVVTRIAPSPTGLLHIGLARSALYNYLYARHHGGSFVIRIEDTDRERSKPEYEQSILESLDWLGFSHDGVVRQSERAPEHRMYLERLVAEGHAYISSEPSKQDPEKTVELVRLRNPGRTITFEDEIRGEITFDTTELGDMIIARSLGDPLYHFAVVADDYDMGITHVIRGEDHISNTPRQILIQEALGAPRPHYAHLPLILAPDRSKMSKRHGAVAITEYKKEGFLPEAIVNYLALLGWSAGDDRELYTLDELIEAFNLSGVHKGGAIFSKTKLGWFNQYYLRELSEKEQNAYLLQTPGISETPLAQTISNSPALCKDVLERITHHAELAVMITEEEFDFLDTTDPTYPLEALVWKKDPDIAKTKQRLAEVIQILDNVEDDRWSASALKEAVWNFAESEGKGSVLWPVRYALSGRDRSPDPFTLAEALGKETTLRRLSHAHSLCETVL